MKKVAVILSGCGAMDGAEIHESVLLISALARAGVEYHIFAPNRDQKDVVDFISGEPMNESRNILIESARIARGQVKELSELNVEEFDGLALPGGFGAAKNLFTFAYDGLDFTVCNDVEMVIKAFHNAQKPIAAMCIAPMLLAKLLGSNGVEITLGPDTELCKEVEARFGAKITSTSRDGVVVDRVNRAVTTPAYMYGDNTIVGVGDGATNMVAAFITL